MIALTNNLGIDEHLRAVQINGERTGLELAQDKVAAKNLDVREDLSVAGNLKAYSQYQMDLRICNYYATTNAEQFIPLSGYIIQRPTSANSNEYVSMIAPYNGTIEKILWRSEIAQSGTFRVYLNEAADGTEIPGVTKFRITDGAMAIADDITYDLNTTSGFDLSDQNNVLTKGNLYNISIQPPAAPYDTNCTVVFKWDILS